MHYLVCFFGMIETSVRRELLNSIRVFNKLVSAAKHSRCFAEYYVRELEDKPVSVPSFLKQIAPSVPVAQPPEHGAKDTTYIATIIHIKTKQTKQKKKLNQTSPTQESIRLFCWPGGICRKG